MKRLLLPACLLLMASCSPPVWGDKSAAHSTDSGSWGPALTVLEHQCVHCHGDNRLSTMPPINDTHALSKLIGSHWIVPGQPQTSRLFQVVTFPDQAPGAMPPSGHAISKHEVQILHNWIKAGAKLPAQNVKLIPVGPLPRSI